MVKMHGWLTRIALLSLVLVLTLAGFPVQAGGEETLSVPVGESIVLAVQNLERVAVADPATADVLVASAVEVIVIGKKLGTTSLHLWENGQRHSFLIKVELDGETLAAQIREALADPAIQVRVVQGTVFLDGKVEEATTAERAEKVARALTDKVVNLIQTPASPAKPDASAEASAERQRVEKEKAEQERVDKERAAKAKEEARQGLAAQVAAAIGVSTVKVSVVSGVLLVDGSVATEKDVERVKNIAEAFGTGVVDKVSVSLKIEPVEPPQVLLQVQVAEVSTNSLSQLGIIWGGMSANSDGKLFYDQGVNWVGEGAAVADIGKPIGRISPLVGHVDAMLKDGNGKLLAAPALVTRSGKQAEFLAGGEIPVPVINKDGGYTIYWKEYGVKLAMQPEVRVDGEITVHLKPEVSTLDWANGAKISGGTVPALKTRRAEADVRLQDGATLVIGGLLNSEDAKNSTGLPGLSKLPIIGALFSSKGFQTGQTQLVIFVTPHLLKEGQSPQVPDVTSLSAPGDIPASKPAPVLAPVPARQEPQGSR